MGLFDKPTGTRHPGAGATPRPAGEVRAALLGSTAPTCRRADVPYRVRDGTPSVPESHEVRAMDEQWQVTWVGDTRARRFASTRRT